MKKNVTTSEFIQAVENIKGCQFAAITYTKVKEQINRDLQGGKSNPFYGRLSCVKVVGGLQLGKSYENAVNNRTEGDFEGTFVAEPLPWGTWRKFPYTIENKGKNYVRFYTTASTTSNTTYYLDGNKVVEPTEIEAIKAAFRQKKESAKQQAVGVVGEEQVKPFNIEVSAILSANINHDNYTIAHII